MIRFFLFGLAVAAATVAFMLYQTDTKSQNTLVEAPVSTPQQAVPEVQVLVAQRSLPARHRITSGDFGWVAWPQTHVQPFFTIASGVPYLLTNLEGRYTGRSYGGGEPLDVSTLENHGIERLSDRVTLGMRAVAISVSAQSTAGGFVMVDDYVDIIRVADVRAAQPGSTVILENVRVLAVGSSMKDADLTTEAVGVDPGTVTVELSPQQATILAAADFEGRLAFALRARSDHLPITSEIDVAPVDVAPVGVAETVLETVITPAEKPRHSIGVLKGETWVPYEVQ